MLKKVLSTAVLGVSALSVMAANAAVPGVYVTGQLGYALTKPNLGLVTPDGKKTYKSVSKFNHNLDGRVAIGLEFNKNFGAEVGYLRLAKQKQNSILFTPASGFVGPNLAGSASIQQSAIDLLGKGMIPVNDRFSLYAKAGLAYMITRIDGQYKSADEQLIPIDNKTAGVAEHKFAPEVAIGASYNVTQNVFVDTSLTHIQPLGKNRPNNIDSLAIGLGYKFG
jgi:OOP family OmpA-OmpF porin